MKKLYSIFLFFVLFFGFAQAQTITIGTGTSSTYLYGPMYRLSSTSTTDFSRYQYLYTATELAGLPAGATITDISWYKANNLVTNPNATFRIYTKNSTAGSLVAGTAWTSIISGATLSYSSTTQVIPATIGWIPFTLSTPIVYNGQNLEIATDWDISIPATPSTGAINWQYSTVSTGQVIMSTGTTSAPATLASSYTSRPNIRITYTVPAVDMAVSAITPISPVMGNNTVQVTLRNQGSNSLNGIPVTLSYSTDGGTSWSPAENFTGTTLGAIGNTQVYSFTNLWNVTAGGSYNLCARINTPGVASDANPSNDQFCQSVCVGYSGTYTVGGVAPTFTTLTNAVNTIISCGMSGPVTLNIRPGTYTEQVNIPAIPGSSTTNVLTIKSENNDSSSVNIEFNSSVSTAQHTIRFNGGSNIILSKLTIKGGLGASVYARTIEFNSNSSNVTITNSRVYAPNTGSSLYVPIYANTTAANNNVSITNNLIDGGYYAIYGRFGTSTAILATNINISGNTIRNYYYYGIYGYYLNGITIAKNSIRGIGSYQFSYGMYLYYSNASLPGVIEQNEVINVGAYGIYLSSTGGNSTTNNLTIKNNMVAGFTGLTSTIYGMYSSGGNFINFYNNSIRANQGSTVYAMYLSSGNNINLRNNVISNNHTAGYAIYKPSAASVVSDFNCFYSASASLAYWNTTVCADLTALQTASGANVGSIQHDVAFINDTNLHTNDAMLYKAGQSIAGITNDFDGDTRFTPPSIGADELSPYDLEATSATFALPPLASFNNNLSFTLTNVRDMAITNPNVYFKRKGDLVPIASEVAMTTINPAGTYVHVFTTPYIPSATGNDTLIVWLSQSLDKNFYNDTLEYGFVVQRVDGRAMTWVAPNANVLENSTQTIRVKIKNQSSIPIYDFQMSYKQNALPVVTETYTDTLQAGDTTTYTFTTPYTASPMGMDNLKAWITVARDQNHTNDTVSKSIATDRKDITVTTLSNPTASVLSINSQQVVKVYLRNPGTLPMSLSQVTYQEIGKTPVTEGFVGTVNPNDSILFSFSTLYMPTTAGAKTFKVWAKTTGDVREFNDTLIKTFSVQSVTPIDIAPRLAAPTLLTSGNNTISMYVRNLGVTTLTTAQVSYQVNTNPIVTETFNGSVTAGDSALYTFTTPAMITDTVVTICLTTSNPNTIGDANTTNDNSCKVVKAPTTSVQDNNLNVQNWVVYPIPAKDKLYQQFTLTQTQNLTIRLVDMSGKVLIQNTQKFAAGSHTLPYDISQLTQGTYLLSIVSDKGVNLTKTLTIIP